MNFSFDRVLRLNGVRLLSRPPEYTLSEPVIYLPFDRPIGKNLRPTQNISGRLFGYA